MPSINPYLNFNGNTEEAFLFYKSVFGGEFVTLQRFKDVPGESNMASADQEKIMHVSLPLGEGSILMGSDVLESHGHPKASGNNISLSIDVKTTDEADKIFNALAAGGQITMPLENTFWGSYFGMLTDKFGIQWMVSTEHKPQ